MHASQTSGLRKLHLALDALVIVASMGAAYVTHTRLQVVVSFVKHLPAFEEYASLVYLSLPLWLVLIVAFDLHTTLERPRPSPILVADLAKVHLAALVAISLVQFTVQARINRSLVGTFLAWTFLLMFLERSVMQAWVQMQHRRGQNQQRLLLVGQPTKRMSDFLRDAASRPLPPQVLGYLRPTTEQAGLSMPPPGATTATCLGDVTRLSALLHEQPTDHVLFFPPCNRPEELRAELSACEALGVKASFSVSLVQLNRALPRVSTLGDHPFVTFDVAPKPAESLALKHGLDPILAALGLVLVAPLLLVIAVMIALTMGRPVLFAQSRAGLYGRPFKMLKFRTMRLGAEQEQAALSNAETMNGPIFKAGDDPRITPLGRLLRRTSLDELPQLFNVLTGAMSLVGPRPLPLNEQQQILGWQRRRLSMKPGITCLWQVSGRSDLDFDEWMALDLKYIDEWSLALDLTVLLRTIPAVLSRRGAR